MKPKSCVALPAKPCPALQSAFINEEVEGILQSVVDEVLEKKEYKEDDVPGWIDAICDGVMARLAAVKPFKYIVHCTIAQDTGAGIHSADSFFWDGVNDNHVTYKWPSQKKSEGVSMYCIASVFGAAVFNR